MTFNYEDKSLSKAGFNPVIGQEWAQQGIKNKYLNTIFGMVDDGDGILQENEFNLLNKLLEKADSINKKTANNATIENAELKALIEKVENDEIDLDDVRSEMYQTFNPELYTKENLKKRYPADLYEINIPMSNQVSIKNKITGQTVLEVIDNSREGLLNDVNTVSVYDSEGKESWYCYSASTNELEAYYGTDGVRHEVLPELLYDDITAKKYGIFSTTGENFEAHLSMLNKYNIENVMASYKELSGNSLISDIFTERGLSSEKRAELAKKIIDIYIESRNRFICGTKGFKESMYEVVDKEKDSFGPMSVSKIDDLMKQLEDRANIIIPEQIGLDSQKVCPNGKIDNDFSQGSVGDCWLLGAIASIMNNPVTAQILNDQISVDANGNVTIDLKFVGKTYTFSYEEILEQYKLSDGDFDLRALEMAVMKYIDEETVISKYRSLITHETVIDGNVPNYAYEILLGKGGILNDAIYSQSFVTSSLIDKIKSGKYLMVAGKISLSSSESDFSVKDNNDYEHRLNPNHAYAVMGADDEFVYVKNPWDTSSTLSVPIDEFVDYFSMVSMYEISEAIEKANELFDFGPDAIVYDNGVVHIPNQNIKYSTDKENLSMCRQRPSQDELNNIRTIHEQRYGDKYKVDVNEWGDVLLTPHSLVA